MEMDLKYLNKSQGFKMVGARDSDNTGVSVSSAGDINHDGIDDLIIGASGATAKNGKESGVAYLVYGQRSFAQSSPNMGDIPLDSLDGKQGFKILGEHRSAGTGISVSGIDDINGDGIDDMAIGAFTASPLGRAYAGISYVIYGKLKGYAQIDLANLDPSEGFKIQGGQAEDESGFIVSRLGDINHDGLNDLGIGACNASPLNRTQAGLSYVLYGKIGAHTTIDLNATLDRSIGFKLIGAHGGAFGVGDLSCVIHGIGDINQDGIADFAVGAFNADPLNRYSQGMIYVIYGIKEIRAEIDLKNWNPEQGFRLFAAYDDRLGGAIDCAGDVNGDGIADMIVGGYEGMPLNRTQAGISYVIYGKVGGYTHDMDLRDFNATYGFKVLGETNTCSGSSVAGIGDMNRDGIDDIAIGASCGNILKRSESGSAYIVYGKSGGYLQDVDLMHLGDQGWRIDGATPHAATGQSVSALDFNGDKIKDLLIGAPGAIERHEAVGVAYLLYGNNVLADLANPYTPHQDDQYETGGAGLSTQFDDIQLD